MTIDQETAIKAIAFDRIRSAAYRSNVLNSDGSKVLYYPAKSGLYVCADCDGRQASRILDWDTIGLCQIDPILNAERVLLEQVSPHWETDNAGC